MRVKKTKMEKKKKRKLVNAKQTFAWCARGDVSFFFFVQKQNVIAPTTQKLQKGRGGGIGGMYAHTRRATHLVAGVISALRQQRFDEEPSHDAHASDSGAAAASLGACSCRLPHVLLLVATAAPSSRHAAATPRGPLNTSMIQQVLHWPLAVAAQSTAQALPPPPPPPPPAEDPDPDPVGGAHPPSVSWWQAGQNRFALSPQ